MTGEYNLKTGKKPFAFYLVCFVVLLVLLGAAVLLLPVLRDYRSTEIELARLKAELEKLKAERNERLAEVTALRNSPDAVEKVAREKFKLVRPGDTVLEYPQPASSAPKK